MVKFVDWFNDYKRRKRGIVVRSNSVQKGFYRHFKGHHYQVIGVSVHSETLKEEVVYRRIGKHANELWHRPIADFLGKTPDGKPRFAFIGTSFPSGYKGDRSNED